MARTVVNNKIIYVSATLSDSAAVQNMSDATNWVVSAAIIHLIKVTTAATDWTLTLYCDSDGSSGMFASLTLADHANGNKEILATIPYKDNDAAGQVHVKYVDNTAANDATIAFYGVQAR